jgi:hypothetical protein
MQTKAKIGLKSHGLKSAHTRVPKASFRNTPQRKGGR